MKELILNGITQEINITDLTQARMVIRFQNSLLKTIAELVEFRDSFTGGHIERTRSYVSVLLGELLKKGIYTQEIDSWDLSVVINSVQLHDVGKIAVPDSILQKPGRLTAEEFDEMKKHASFGEEVIERIGKCAESEEFLKHAKIFAGTHHEKWDGSGYPHGLKGENIPLQGRLMAIADVYDALVSKRSYKEALSHEKAVSIITDGKGAHFDPTLVDIFIETANKFKEIAETYK